MPVRIFFFSSADMLGGAERSLQGLITGLSARGHDCVLITPATAPLARWADEQGLAHEVLETPTLRQRNPLVALRNLVHQRRFARALVARYGPGVFYANTRHAFIMLAGLPARYPKIAHHRDIVSRRVNGLLYPRIDRNIFVSQFNYARSDAPANGQVIYNAAAFDCDLPPVLPDPPPALLRLAMFARITPYKGHRLALDACRHLAQAGQSYQLDIFGEPGQVARDQSLFQALKAEVAQDGLAVTFRGFHDRPQAVMRDYHAILNPSRDEPFGRIPVEAFSLGVPAISHRSGGSVEIYAGLDAYRDYLFDAYTGEALGEALLALQARASDADGKAAHLNEILNETLNEIRTDIRHRFGATRLIDEIAAVLSEIAPGR